MLLVVDVQEKLAPAMPADAMIALERAARILVEAAATLGAAVLATEQYPAGLGRTVGAIAEDLARVSAPVLEKIAFSAVEAPGFREALDDKRPSSVIVIGMETHVCVYQTVRELCARGLEVHVPLDGVCSRRDDHKAVGLELMRSLGARITTAETVVFDWLRKAGTPEFKKLSKLIR